MRLPRLGALLAGIGLPAILVLTLFPDPRRAPVADATPLLCLVCGESGGADVVLNLLLFTPLAAGLALLGWRWTRVVAVCALLSLAVETTQYLAGTGRDASLSDVLTNTASAGLGAAVALRLGLLVGPGPAAARRLSLAAAAAWLGLLLFTAASMRPWTPPGRLRNYCTASYPTGEVFAGTARTMALDGASLACDRDLPDPRGFRRSLRRGRVVLETVATTRGPSGGRAVIHLVRTPDATVLGLVQQGRTAVYHAPTAARAFKLFPPALRLSDAFPTGPDGLVELAAGTTGRRLWLATAHDEGRRSVELSLSPAFGWTLLFPIPIHPGPWLRVLAALWLGGSILPAAYWAGHTRRPAASLGAVGAAAIAGLGLVPALTGFDPVHWSEWAGAGLGVALGWALSRIAAYLQSRCGSPSTSAYSSS